VNILVWLTDGAWEAAVDACRGHAPGDAAVTLLHVVDPAAAEAVRGPWAGLLGRGGRHDPAAELDAVTAAAETELLAGAAARLGRPAQSRTRRGRVEREVTAACAGMDLLILARDGDRSRVGPRSLGPASRFVVDHAPCPVLLVWPGTPPDAELPPPPHPQREGLPHAHGQRPPPPPPH
jgi:nucleotide-binding universal stress UspA family protein